MSNDVAYYARRSRLWDELAKWGASGAYCGDLAVRLGWPSPEVRAKLMSLRVAGRADYDKQTGIWRAKGRG